MRSSFTEELIIGILKEYRAGLGAKFGGMEVFGAKMLNALEAENAKLKTLLAEQMMYRTASGDEP